jgi:hypothetical protein
LIAAASVTLTWPLCLRSHLKQQQRRPSVAMEAARALQLVFISLHVIQVKLLCRHPVSAQEVALTRALPPVFVLRTICRPQNDNDWNKNSSKRARAQTLLNLFFANREWREFRPEQYEAWW